MTQGGKTHVYLRAEHGGHAQRHQRVYTGINFRVPFCRRGNAKQRVDFREQHLQRAAVAQDLEKDLRVTGGEGVFCLFPDALRRQVFQLARLGHGRHQCHCLIGNTEAQMGVTRGKARHAQDAERIFRECRGDMAQKTVAQVILPAVGVDDMAVFVLGEGVNGEIAAQQILLQRYIRRGVAGESRIAGTGFPLGTRQGVLFPAFRVQKHGKIATYLLVARVEHLFRGGAHHHPVFIFDRQT